MAGWLSSKLKEAEQFLQQIDQQAAESLGKPEIQTPNDRRGHRGKTKPIIDQSYADQKDAFREVSAKGKAGLRLEAAPSALSKLVKQSDPGPRTVNGNTGSEAKDPSLYKKKTQLASLPQIARDSDGNGKDDWTELLASPNVDLVASPALASSMGSSDSGRLGYLRGPSSRAKPSTKQSTVMMKISHSTILSEAGSVDFSKPDSSSRFRDGRLPQRVELDLAQFVAVEAEENSGVLVSTTSKNTSANGYGVDLNQAITNGIEDSEESMHVLDSFFKESNKEGGADEAKPSEIQTEGPSKFGEQAGKLPSLSLECKDDFAELNQRMVLAIINNEHDESKSISQNKPRNSFGDAFDGVHGVEKQTNSIQKLRNEIGRTEVSDIPIAYEIGNLELLPVTQALPAFLQFDEESYDSGLMSNADSEGETESEDEENAELQRQKSAHKKRIARRKELTAARAAAAQAAIREHELFVEKLEKEVITLEKVLAEREEQQSREAVELRMSIAEVMHASETEKKLHSSTKMKALALESQLENQNADLANTLGALQWELDQQMSQILKARSMIESKEAAKSELERKIANMHSNLYCQKIGESKLPERDKDEDCSFEEEHSDLWKKIQQCQIKVKDMEVKIRGLKDTQHVPTDIEQELEKRLAQMTDYLIQKQAQVEALSTEKATLLIRIEALSHTIEEERAMASSQASRKKLGGQRNSDWDYYDMEYGLDRSYVTRGKHSAFEFGESSATASSMGSVPLSPVLHQLSGFFSAGMFYLRKHRWAQAFFMMYIIILHMWVGFVVFMNSKPTQTLEFGLPKNVSELKDSSYVTNLL